jgi:hypothetical protein
MMPITGKDPLFRVRATLKPIIRPYTVANYHSHGFRHQQDLNKKVSPIACTFARQN